MNDQQRILQKSHDKVIGGVCGGLAEYFGWNPSKFRLAYVLISILSAAFPGALVYLVFWLCMPSPDDSR
ncbi:MAG: PspC domain-containing protein [bacterium]